MHISVEIPNTGASISGFKVNGGDKSACSGVVSFKDSFGNHVVKFTAINTADGQYQVSGEGAPTPSNGRMDSATHPFSRDSLVNRGIKPVIAEILAKHFKGEKSGAVVKVEPVQTAPSVLPGQEALDRLREEHPIEPRAPEAIGPTTLSGDENNVTSGQGPQNDAEQDVATERTVTAPVPSAVGLKPPVLMAAQTSQTETIKPKPQPDESPPLRLPKGRSKARSKDQIGGGGKNKSDRPKRKQPERTPKPVMRKKPEKLKEMIVLAEFSRQRLEAYCNPELNVFRQLLCLIFKQKINLPLANIKQKAGITNDSSVYQDCNRAKKILKSDQTMARAFRRVCQELETEAEKLGLELLELKLGLPLAKEGGGEPPVGRREDNRATGPMGTEGDGEARLLLLQEAQAMKRGMMIAIWVMARPFVDRVEIARILKANGDSCEAALARFMVLFGPVDGSELIMAIKQQARALVLPAPESE